MGAWNSGSWVGPTRAVVMLGSMTGSHTLGFFFSLLGFFTFVLGWLSLHEFYDLIRPEIYSFLLKKFNKFRSNHAAGTKQIKFKKVRSYQI